MAELHVQPKKKASILPWILALLVAGALIWWFFLRNKDENNTVVAASQTSDSSSTHPAPATAVHGSPETWDGIDFESPSVSYGEVTDKKINVRGTGNYAIYGLGENILFDEGKSTIRPAAESNLKQIAGSISKRYNGGNIRVYGFTDAQGSTDANKELAEQRADAVKTWLQSNGVDESHISVNAIGEAKPVATNSTENGRQQNRRVEIVARGGNASQ